MSIVVPPVDLAPSLPSRIVTVKLTDLPEGGLIDAPGWIEFVLPGDLRVPANDIIVRAGSVRLELDASGEGQVRLPVHNPAAQGDGVGGDWYLLVRKSWTKQVDMIRVPAGSGSVSLAKIAPVVEVTPEMGQWLLTNATVTVQEGAAWHASVATSGGVAHFAFTVPPGGEAWMKGTLTTSDDLASLTPGAYRVPSSSVAAALGIPGGREGTVEMLPTSDGGRVIRFTSGNDPESLPLEIWVLTDTDPGAWNRPWERVYPDPTVVAVERKTASMRVGLDDQWRLVDKAARSALAVDARGDVRVGATTHSEGEPGWRVRDQHGRVAFEVDAFGRTHINDLATGQSSTVTTLHVFGAFGQSNMQGTGTPADVPNNAKIKQFGANNRVLEQAPAILDMVGTASGMSPATFFAQHYLASQPAHVGVLLVPGARGGTAFRGTPEEPATDWTWTKGAAPDPQYALYERSVQQMLDAVAAAEAAGYDVIVRGVLWHQGEGNGGRATAEYAALLDNLISDYRTDLDAPNLPFVVGQMCHEGMIEQPAKLTVDAAHRDTPARVPYTGFAPSAWDAHRPGDTTHFNAKGVRLLGDTYMTGYLQALGNVHPN